MNNQEREKYNRAKKRVDEIKGFYIHFTVYLLVNAFILINIARNTDDFWEWYHFVTAFFWGIGVFFHWLNVFGKFSLFGKSWEERQIKKYMDKDRDNSQKFL